MMQTLDLAVVRCPDCGETRTISGRQARRLELGDAGKRRCSLRRYTFKIRVTAEHRAWAQTAWAGWTPAERVAVAYALTARDELHP